LLDGLDEAAGQITDLTKSIPEVLRNLASTPRALQGLRLRMTCRSPIWPADLEAELRGLWEPKGVGVYELAPLRKVDVQLAAPQTPAFLNYVEKNDLQTLWRYFDVKPRVVYIPRFIGARSRMSCGRRDAAGNR